MMIFSMEDLTYQKSFHHFMAHDRKKNEIIKRNKLQKTPGSHHSEGRLSQEKVNHKLLDISYTDKF